MNSTPQKSKHAVDSQVLQDVLNYLSNRPYGEVSALVQAIMQSAEQVQNDVVQKAE